MEKKKFEATLKKVQKKMNYNKPKLKEIGKIETHTKGGGTQSAFDSGFPQLVPS